MMLQGFKETLILLKMQSRHLKTWLLKKTDFLFYFFIDLLILELLRHYLFTLKVLLKFKEIDIYSLIFKEEVVETPYDLPRELQGMKLQMENFKPHDEILKFKDIIIWGLIELRQKSIEEI